jgi:hypothetical protein
MLGGLVGSEQAFAAHPLGEVLIGGEAGDVLARPPAEPAWRDAVVFGDVLEVAAIPLQPLEASSVVTEFSSQAVRSATTPATIAFPSPAVPSRSTAATSYSGHCL